MRQKISVVTTCHHAGYQAYGRRMAETFRDNWPGEIDLWFYTEGFDMDQVAPNIQQIDLHSAAPNLVEFKKKYSADARATGRMPMGPVDRRGKQPGIGFRWDAVRFSHKVYAMCHAAKQLDRGLLFWMDADMVCHGRITQQFVRSQIPPGTGVAFLGRVKKFTETGLWAIDLDHEHSKHFIDRMQWAYDDAEHGVLAMEEFHDCWVFDRCREWMLVNYPTWQQLNWNQGSIQGEGHPLINSAWGAYLDHLKGRRKDLGRSKPQDLIQPRQEGYWQQ